jgi:hypothetical protein
MPKNNGDNKHGTRCAGEVAVNDAVEARCQFWAASIYNYIHTYIQRQFLMGYVEPQGQSYYR